MEPVQTTLDAFSRIRSGLLQNKNPQNPADASDIDIWRRVNKEYFLTIPGSRKTIVSLVERHRPVLTFIQVLSFPKLGENSDISYELHENGVLHRVFSSSVLSAEDIKVLLLELANRLPRE